MELQPHQERVIAERKELDEKIKKLYGFLGGKVFLDLPLDEQEMLERQYRIMNEYLQVLQERIDLWAPTIEEQDISLYDKEGRFRGTVSRQAYNLLTKEWTPKWMQP